jgi:hypothetical protein
MRAFGADRFETGTGEELFLVCPAPKSWIPRQERTLTRAEYPGTAVECEGRILEVRAAEPQGDGGVRYRLAPWEEGHAIRRLERYDAANEQARASEQADRGGNLRKRRLAIVLAPLAGLLPGAVQKKMESEFGAPSIAMTISSALPLFVVGFLGVFERFVGGLGGGLGWPVWLVPPLPIALYLFMESALRLGSAVAMGEPMGSLPVTIAYEAWRESRNPRGEKASPGSSPTAPTPAEGLHDRYRMLEPLLSLLPGPEQRDLEKRFGFDAIRWGRITAATLLAVGGGNALASLLNLGARHGSVADLAWLLAGGFLAIEQVRRWRRFSRGEPAGSVLSALVRPLAKPLFEVRRGPAARDSP